MEQEYERQMKHVRDRLEVARRAIKEAETALEVVAETLIQQDAPRDVEHSCTDIIEAGATARSTCRQVADLATEAAEVGKAASAVGKKGGKIEFAARHLFADLLQRAEREEERRQEERARLEQAEEERQLGLGLDEEERRVQTSSPSAETMIADEAPEEEPWSLAPWLAKAREQARDDAGFQRRLHDGDKLAMVLDVPEELASHKGALYAAYLDVLISEGKTRPQAQAEEAPKKRGRGRPKKSA